MSKEFRKAIIEAAKILSRDPSEVVECPICGEYEIIVEDSESGVERLLKCPKDGLITAIRNPDPENGAT